jgi:hypothetical protein
MLKSKYQFQYKHREWREINHLWFTSMVYIYDLHIWFTYMIYIYDLHIKFKSYIKLK